VTGMARATAKRYVAGSITAWTTSTPARPLEDDAHAEAPEEILKEIKRAQQSSLTKAKQKGSGELTGPILADVSGYSDAELHAIDISDNQNWPAPRGPR
jgi:hypothetical protein